MIFPCSSPPALSSEDSHSDSASVPSESSHPAQSRPESTEHVTEPRDLSDDRTAAPSVESELNESMRKLLDGIDHDHVDMAGELEQTKQTL